MVVAVEHDDADDEADDDLARCTTAPSTSWQISSSLSSRPIREGSRAI
jgi:hypothetical protein